MCQNPIPKSPVMSHSFAVALPCLGFLAVAWIFHDIISYINLKSKCHNWVFCHYVQRKPVNCVRSSVPWDGPSYFVIAFCEYKACAWTWVWYNDPTSSSSSSSLGWHVCVSALWLLCSQWCVPFVGCILWMHCSSLDLW